MLDGYKNVREWRIWTRGGARWEKPCRFGGGVLRLWSVGCGIWNLEWGMRHGNVLPRIAARHRTMRVALSKNTDFTDAHGWVFSRIVYSCSAAYCLVFDAPPARQIDTDFFAGGKYNEVVCHMTGLGMRSDGYAQKVQKFIAQRQAKRRPGYNVPCSLRPVGAKVLKHSVLCLLLPLQGVV